MGHENSQKLFTYQLRALAATGVFIALLACSPGSVQIVASPSFYTENITPIAIFNFQLDTPKASEGQFMLSNSSVTPTATATVTKIFYKVLSNKFDSSIVSMDNFEKASSNFTIPDFDTDPSYTVARKIGKSLSAKTLLLGSITQYRDRVGNALGIKEPATVGFKAKLVSVLDGKTLWEAHFFETQRPMTSDLQGFLQRRRWLTAEELATDGVNQVLAKWKE